MPELHAAKDSTRIPRWTGASSLPTGLDEVVFADAPFEGSRLSDDAAAFSGKYRTVACEVSACPCLDRSLSVPLVQWIYRDVRSAAISSTGGSGSVHRGGVIRRRTRGKYAWHLISPPPTPSGATSS
ncbi:hypothetical protein GCM10010439_73950 [Actinocorallia aurantiaca]|uniref:Uncharacterized protein n=1 Tax=Actinocorallia aurantiaca TaxID=46204 RepID=A0ABP6HA18_9ACTN